MAKSKRKTKKSTGKAGARPRYDWEAIEPDYRAGVMSLQQICDKHGVISKNAIVAYAKRHGWMRDLSVKIARETHRRAAVDAAQSIQREPAPPMPADKEARTIEIAVQTNLTVIRSHRSSIMRASEMVGDLMDQLSVKMGAYDTLADLVAALTTRDDGKVDTKTRAALMQMLGTGADAKTLQTLVETMSTLIKLERQAFSIKDGEETGGEETYEDKLRRLHEAAGAPETGRLIDGEFAVVPDAPVSSDG